MNKISYFSLPCFIKIDKTVQLNSCKKKTKPKQTKLFVKNSEILTADICGLACLVSSSSE